MPHHRARPPAAPGAGPAALRRTAAVQPLADRERERLEALLDALPAPLEPLDVSALDGFLVGVLLQPKPPPAGWLAHVHDADGRPAPAGAALAEIDALVLRRHAELGEAIGARRWFDPWVFELEAAPGRAPSPAEAVLPWVAGFAAAMDLYPAALRHAGDDAREPLALIYQHFDPDDLEDADDLAETIESLEPPATLAEAVEQLVRATLLLADALLGAPPQRQQRHRHS